jgi:hypothetical protein
MPVLQDQLAFSIPHVFEGQAVGYFAITVLAIVAIMTLGCATLYLLRRLERAKPTNSAEIREDIDMNASGPDRPGLARRISCSRRSRVLGR